MPDITQRIGIDSIDQRILAQASQERFDKIFQQVQQPNLPNPNATFDPLKNTGQPQSGSPEYNPNLQTPIVKQMDSALAQQVKEVQAIQATHDYLKKKDPLYYKGLGETKYLPYQPLEKYLGETYGFKPDSTKDLQDQVDFNEDAYAQVKNGAFNSIGKFLGRTALGAVAKAGQGLAYLGGLATGIINPMTWYGMLNNNEDYLTAAGDNVLAKAFDYLDTNVKNSWMPVYQEASSKGQGFWYRLIHDGSFWQSEISDGAAFALSAFVPSLLASKLGIGANAIAALSRGSFAGKVLGTENAVLGAADVFSAQRNADAFASASKYLQNASRIANTVDKSVVTLANTISESYFESRETYGAVFNKLKEQGKSDLEAKKGAQDASRGTFFANIPALLFSNAFETKLQFQALGMNSIENEALHGIAQKTAFGKYLVEPATTRFGKFLESPLGFYAKKLPEAILKEGYWEENIQQAIQRYYQNPDNSKDGLLDQMKGIGKNYVNQTVQATIGNDPETSISIGLGGLMGAGHTMISSAIANEYANNKKFRDETVNHLNSLQDNWLKYGDPFERNENGDIVIQERTEKDGTIVKEPKVSEARVLAYMSKINTLSEKLAMTDNVKNEVIHGFMKDALFAELVVANINAGTIDSFKENLKRSKNYSEEDLAKLGLEKGKDFANSVDANLKLAEKVEALDKSITDDVLFKQVKDKNDVEVERLRRSELLRSGILQIVMKDAIDKNTTELNTLENKLNTKYDSKNSDAIVRQLNALQSEIRYNEQFVNNPDYDSVDIASANKLLEKSKDAKEKLLKDNEEILANVKQNSDGSYKYENNDRERDPDFTRVKKLQNRIAQLKNSHGILAEEWYRNADVKNGLANFKKRSDEKDAIAEAKIKEQVANNEVITTPEETETTNPFLTHKEHTKGDFAKVSGLASRIIFGEKITTPEDLQLQQTYSDLLEKLIPLYANKVKEIRTLQLQKRLKYYQGLRDEVLQKISDTKKKIGDLDVQADEIIADFKNQKTDEAKVKLQKIVKKIQDDIYKLEEFLDKSDKNLAKYDERISNIQNEINDPTIESVLSLKKAIETEKKELADSIEETKGLLNKLKKLLKELVQMARDLFVSFDPVTGKPRSTYEENLNKGRHEAFGFEGEILSEAVKINNLKSKLKELQGAYAQADKNLSDVNKIISEFKAQFNSFRLNLTKDAAANAAQIAKEKPKYTEAEIALNKIYDAEIPPGGTNTVPFDRNIYDGDGYLRSLETVFFASTDPNQGTGTERTENHLEFLSNVALMPKAELTKKLGPNGRLEMFIVTGENINSFNMDGLVDKKFLDTSDIARTGIYMVYAIRRGNNTYFVDKNLDTLDKVGELKDENKNKIVFGALRAGEYRQGEKERYDMKHAPGATDKALANGLKYRQNLIKDSRTITPTNLTTHRFAISRGIANKAEADEDFVKNSVTSTIISEDDINADSITVATLKDTGTEFEKRIVNGVMQHLPVGRPLLLTSNSANSQYHYLDNNILSEERKAVIKQVLHNLAKELSEAVDKQITELNGGVAVEKNTPKYLSLMGQLARDRKEQRITLLNQGYINFLKGVLYFRKLDDKLPVSAANERQIWLRGDKIVFSNAGDRVYLDDPESILASKELDNFLSGYHHNYNALNEKDRARSFTEYYLDKGKLETRVWPTYAHYMLSAKHPDGSVRTDIPLTTKIKTRQESEAERQFDGKHIPYIQRASIIVTDAQESIDKNREKAITTASKDEKAVQSVSLLNKLMGTPQETPAPSAAQPAAPQAETKLKNSADLLNAMIERQAKPEAPAAEAPKVEEAPPIPPAPQGPIAPIDPRDIEDITGFDENFRTVTNTNVITEADIQARRDEVRKMLPQIEVKIVDRLIDTVLGRQAWGQWTGSAIVVFEGSEEGTIYHEAFEALVNSILTDKEWDNLHKEFKSRKGSFTDRDTGKVINYANATAYQAKEELAEEFRDYKLTGKVWSGEKVKMNFFQRLIKFLTDLINNLGTIEKTFSQLDKGFYGNRALSLRNRFNNNYRLINDIPEVYYHKLIQGATALMFRSVFVSNKSFTDFDNDRVSEDKLYADLRKTLSDRYEEYLKMAMNRPENDATRNALMTAYQTWSSINARWNDFVQDHKTFLLPFKIKFVEDAEPLDENEDRDSSVRNRNDYQRNIMEIDAKKTAATSIRLLFATLVNAKFAMDKSNNYKVDANGMPITLPEVSTLNTMFLPELVNYDEIVKTVFNNLTGLNNISRIEERLREISGIEEVHNSPDVQATIAGLDNKQATLVTLYNRLFGGVKEHDEETRWKMKVKANNFLAKQNPKAEIMVVTGSGESYFIESNAKEAYEDLRRKVNLHVKGLRDTRFGRVVKDKKAFFKAPDIKVYDLRTIEEFHRIISGWFNLGEEFTTEFLKSLTGAEFENIANQLRRILTAMKYNNDNENIKHLSTDGLGIEGRLKDILKFYINKTTSGTESQFLNIDKKPQQNYVLNNYMSRVLTDLNAAKTYEEFILDNPQLASTYSKDSLVLARMFTNGKRNEESLQLGYVEGILNSSTRSGQKNSQLSFTDRLILAFNSNLKGIFYTLLPADSETEWDLNLGEFVEFSNNFESTRRDQVLNILGTYLETEIRVAQEEALGDLQQTNAKYSNGDKVGSSLRIFRDVLAKDPELLATIHKGIKDNVDPTKIVKDNKKAIGNATLSFINGLAANNKALFLNQGIIERDGAGFRFNLMYRDFAEKVKGRTGEEAKGKQDGYYFTEDQINDIMRYHATNFFIANTEMFKLFFSDPAQYKDLTKRVKSFTSGVEWSYYERSEENGDTGFNGYLNTNKNSVEYTDDKGEKQSLDIPTTDMFNYRYGNNLNLLVVSDLMVADVELYNQLMDENLQSVVKDLAKAADTYGNINEADAQSVTDIQTYKEVMIKSGWRWTAAHEEQFQYEMAYTRNALSKKGKYEYSSPELKAMDKAILAKYETAPKLAAFTPIKPLYAGVDNNEKGSMRLLKTSIYPITYRLAEGRELEELYLKMLKGMNNERVNIFTFESSQKVGLTLDKNNQITPAYDPNKPGNLNDFTKAGTPISQLSYKHFGIQVETQSSSKGNTLGTQLTKDIKLNLFEDGVPVDYLDREDNQGDRNKALADFYKMSEPDRIKNSEFYRLYKEHESALRDLKTAGYHELLIKVGATEEVDSKGNYSYKYKDLAKVRKIILDEMLGRELDENTIDSVQLTEDLQAFKRAPESMPSYDIIRNILYALVDKAILSPKVNGKPYIQVASSFFNSEKRKAAYFDKETKQWVNINTEKEHKAAVDAKRKVVYTSSELGFYKMSKNGKEVEAMEILLPHIYKQDINEARASKGLSTLSDSEIISYLEKNHPRLLEGIGFRIPTQATSSVEFFKIKGFLPETFGTAVVVPSAITAKAGSDFDVDKLNTYLNNWHLDNKGLPVYMEYKDNSNSTVEERYWSYIKDKYARVIYPVRQAVGKITDKAKKNNAAIRKLEEDLKTFDEVFNTAKNYDAGMAIAKLFNVAITDMQTAMKADETLRSLEQEGEQINQMLENAQNEYQELIKGIQEELPLEKFRSLPVASQNSKEALENRYFQSIRNILSTPYNFQYLLSPNSNENLIANRDAVRKAEDPEGKKTKSKDINHAKFLDFDYMNTQRHYFVRGKQDIGIFAVSMTNYANSQISGLVVAPITDIRKDNAFYLTDLNNNDFRLPFDYKTITIDKQEYISLSSRQDVDNQSIMDKVSGYINGAVDVAKDPIIMDMGMLSELAGVYIFLERIGVPGQMVALFMKQPIIRDFIHESQLRKSALRNRSSFNNAKEIITYLIGSKYSDGKPYAYEHVKLGREDLERMLNKAAKATGRQTVGKDFTKKELHLQQLILADYLKAKVFSDHLQEVVQSSNHDTSMIRNNHIIARKNWQAEDAVKGNVIKSLANATGMKDGSSSIKEKTFVGNDVNILNRLERLYGEKIFSLQKDNPARLIKYLGKKVYYATKFTGIEEFESGLRQVEVALLDYLASNARMVGIGGTVKSVTDRLFLNEITRKEGVVANKDSIHSMYRDLMKKIFNSQGQHPLKDNVLLHNLSFMEDKIAGITTFELTVKPQGNDIYTKNRITEAFRALRDNEDSRRLYTALKLGAIIQNGVGYSRASINNLVPNEDYGEQINEGLKNIERQDFSSFEEILARTNLYHTLIGKPDIKAVFYVDANPTGGLVSIEKTKYIDKPSPTNRNFFGKGPIPPALFLYAGKDDLNPSYLHDYIVMEMIHPRYILGPEDGYTNAISPDVKEMAKKGDYSFIERILLKKVGLEKGKVIYVEDQKKDGAINFMAMYKPINHWGNNNFNEIRNVNRDDAGEWVGEASILKDRLKIQELSDTEIMNILDASKKDLSIFVVDDPTNFKNDIKLSMENQNNSLSLPENEIDQKAIDDAIGRFEKDSEDCIT